MGFLELQQGNIEIISNNKIISLNNLNSNQRHKLFSWLPQNPTFPNESIKQHFQRIAPAVKENEIIALLRELQLDPHRLKAGLNTMLGSSESNLSVGENRRIAIARAILHPAPILILDEPTASLDDETESVVNKIIANQVAAGRLVLMISHRIAPNLGLQK
jgi:ABC-type transport system involved in cytochrome bd biosynthesis fused ATPase/permease subunit